MHKATDVKALTTEQPFFHNRSTGIDYFHFAAGVPVDDALEQAVVHLEAADSLLNPEDLDANRAIAVSLLIQSAKAAIDAAVSGLLQSDGGEGLRTQR